MSDDWVPLDDDTAWVAINESQHMNLGPPHMVNVTCPSCGQVGTCSWHWVLVAKPLGTFSLAGSTMKVSAIKTIEVTCSVCPLVMRGIPGGDIVRIDNQEGTS